ncbi:MAG TPA: hypothetical protein VK002_14455 [Rubricoccaceae bacterium]|nr:hypothetical protein [Rubricoccaceae bacterium]
MSTPSLPAAAPLPPRLRAILQTLQERRTRTAADRELARRIQFAVESARIEDVGGLSFYVHEGSVAVYGAIRTEALRERVLGLVAEQPGVRRIQDHLQLPAA